MSEVDRFIVSNDKGMNALPHVLRKHRKSANVYSIYPTDKSTCFQLGWDDKPDSDWGRYRGAVLRVIVPAKAKDYEKPVEAAIRKALGWPPLESKA